VNGNTGTQFDNPVIPGSSGVSSSGNQLMTRVALMTKF
jgi:hypothetical protein